MKQNEIVWKRGSKSGAQVWIPYAREYAPETPSRPYPTIWDDLHTPRQSKAHHRELFRSIENPTVREIPRVVLARCEWDRDDYNRNVANLPIAQPEPQAPAITPPRRPSPAPAQREIRQESLFEDEAP